MSLEVKVCMHQGSALSPLLFLVVMEALSREFRVALPWELLYTMLNADDWVVVAETEDDLIKMLNEWKDHMKNRGMRVNMNKTRTIEQQKVKQKAAIWPCGGCGRSVGNNSIQCITCQNWVHKCSGIKSSMSKVMKAFICKGFLNPVTSTCQTSVNIGVCGNKELVDNFCYLGDILSVD